MRKSIATTAIVFSTLLAIALPTVADAKHRTHKVWICRNPQKAATTGTIVGALGGALVGSAIAGHDNKTGGAIIGAGVGGLTGRQVAKINAKHNCHYEWRRY